MNHRFANIIAGAVGGLGATLPMSAVMLAWYRKSWRPYLDPLPPRQITENALDAVGLEDDLSNDSQELLTIVNHFGYGTSVGALYGALSGPQQSTPKAIATGVAYGLGVWGASYLGWLPATGLYRSATDDSRERNLLMLAAHVVWGGTLGLIASSVQRQLMRQQPGVSMSAVSGDRDFDRMSAPSENGSARAYVEQNGRHSRTQAKYPF